MVREGIAQRIAGHEVVRGDILILAEGDRVPADASLISCNDFATDESMLTDESVPVRKIGQPDAHKLRSPGGDDLPFVYSGTRVVQGRGTTRVLTPYKDKCHTITFDNGKEFAEHENMAAELKADIYFANPHHSWERGLNENSNGLLRQYFLKGMELTNITEEQVQEAVKRINHRSRKVLGFRTPHGVFFGVELRYTKQPLAVALRT